MTINERRVGNVVILDLIGNFAGADSSDLFSSRMEGLMSELQPLLIVLNMEAVPCVDSMGLGGIVLAYTAISRSGGSLKLLKLTRRVLDDLSITKLLTVFDHFEDETEALKSFAQPPAV